MLTCRHGTYYRNLLHAAVSETVSEMDPGSTVRQSEMRFHQSEISDLACESPRVRKRRQPTGASAHGRSQRQVPAPTGASADWRSVPPGASADGARTCAEGNPHGSERPRYGEWSAEGWKRPRVELPRVELPRVRASTGGAPTGAEAAKLTTASAHGRSERPRVRQLTGGTPTGASACGRSSAHGCDSPRVGAPTGGSSAQPPTGRERPRVGAPG